MSAQEKFEKAEEHTKTLQTVLNYVREARDSDEEMIHSEQSRQSVNEAIAFINAWHNRLEERDAEQEDLEQLTEAINKLALFADIPSQCDCDELAAKVKDLFYTMVAHTTVLYVQAEKADHLDADDDRAFH